MEDIDKHLRVLDRPRENPLDTRHYARAMGNRAKTDRVDAELIARLIAQEHARLRPYYKQFQLAIAAIGYCSKSLKFRRK